MHAPEGYYSWDDVVSHIEHLAGTVLSARVLEFCDEDPTTAFRDGGGALVLPEESEFTGIKTPMEQIFYRGLFNCYLLANFLVRYEPVMCSIDGNVLRTALPICMHADRFDCYLWNWRWGESTESPNQFDAFKEGRLTESDIYERFCSIDALSGRIVVKNNTGRLLDSAMHTDGKDPNYWVDCVRPYVGRSICWHPESIPKSLSAILTGLGFAEEAKWAADADSPGFNMTNAQTNSPLESVLDCVLQAFPEGKGSTTWKEIEKRSGYSRRHIVRAFRANASQKGWLGH